MSSKRDIYAPMGSISSGTMRPEDLIPSMMETLDDIVSELSSPGSTTEPPEQTQARKQEVSRLHDLLGEIEERMLQEDYWEGEDPYWDYETLQDELSAYALPYFYFGSHPGDGADYGFWFCEESFQDDCRNDTILKLDAGDEWPEDELRERREAGVAPDYVAYVNDHGNVSLWLASDKQPEEPIWDIV